MVFICEITKCVSSIEVRGIESRHCHTVSGHVDTTVGSIMRDCVGTVLMIHQVAIEILVAAVEALVVVLIR